MGYRSSDVRALVRAIFPVLAADHPECTDADPCIDCADLRRRLAPFKGFLA